MRSHLFPRTLAVVLTVAAVAGTVTLLLFFAGRGEDFLTIRDDSVGEVLMRRGDRLNKADYKTEALAYYENALKARFAGPQNRTHTFEAAGLILWRLGETEKALEYLEASLAGVESTTAPYEALVDIHLEAGRVEEAAAAWEQWQREDVDPDFPEEAEKRLLASAKLALAQGKEEEARKLLEAGVEEGGGAVFYAPLAQSFARAGEHEKALSCLEAYFLQGGDTQGEAMRHLYRTLRSAETP